MPDSVTSKITNGSNNNYSGNNTSQILISDESENLTIHGYKPSTGKRWITYISYIFTLGLLRLLFHWFPTWQLYSTHSRCSLSTAKKILIVDTYQDKHETYFVEKVQVLEAKGSSNGIPTTLLTAYLDNGVFKESLQLRVVSCKKLFYVWDEESYQFVKLCGIDQGRRCVEFHQINGYSKEEQATRQVTYGQNRIQVPFNTILSLLILEALTPFYIFQVFSLCVWFAEAYYYYTIAIIVMSVFGITSSIIQTRRNQKNLHRSVDSTELVTVCRRTKDLEEISSWNLVPGDIIQIPENGCTMQCDAVLLNGTCIVNESMLTGESVPITKTPIPKTSAIYNVKEDSFHTLFCGTKVIQTRNSNGDRLLAVVVRTGYLTTKGELVRSILYPPPSDFKFDRDSYKYIGILAIIAILGCIYTVTSKSLRSIDASDIALKTLALVTIVVPPALPAAMTVGKLYALSRLKKHNIFCINSRVINVSGSIDCVCFDKTGTLTEDSLDMWGVVPVIGTTLGAPVKDVKGLPPDSDILKGMATCHNVNIIDKQLLGDPLDIKVFESTGWILETENLVKSDLTPQSEHDQRIQVEICRHFQFSSTLQRMSVITKPTGASSYEVYCKGSPEMVASLSNIKTVPQNLHEKLSEYASKGYRVIALARKSLDAFNDIQLIERADAEKDLDFKALIVLENCLKPETPGAIAELRNANIKTVMITGDNIQTAISVAKECGIINNHEVIVDVQVSQKEVGCMALVFNPDDRSNSTGNSMQNKNINLEAGSNLQYKFAINGTNWALLCEYFPSKISELVDKGAVFARMSGQQKQQLIQELQKLGYYVAMCGDGANDCGALKAAHVGVSLSEAESSVASPFTSKDPNISCVPKVIKEGRAALTTSIGVFKYMICYSLTQFTSSLILYGIDANLTAIQFLFIDVCITLNLMLLFGNTEAYKGLLDKKRPLTSLLSFVPLLSLLLQMCLVILFQILAYKIIQTYDWFKPFRFNPAKEEYFTCYENYAVFSVSLFQYIILALCFSKGRPFRMAFYTNKLFVASITLITAISIYIVIYPADWVLSLFELIVPPKFDGPLVMLGLVGLNFILSLLIEDLMIEYLLKDKMLPKVQKLFRYSKRTEPKKRSLLPSDLVNKRRTLDRIIFENKNSGSLDKTSNCYTNNGYQHSEIS